MLGTYLFALIVAGLALGLAVRRNRRIYAEVQRAGTPAPPAGRPPSNFRDLVAPVAGEQALAAQLCYPDGCNWFLLRSPLGRLLRRLTGRERLSDRWPMGLGTRRHTVLAVTPTRLLVFAATLPPARLGDQLAAWSRAEVAARLEYVERKRTNYGRGYSETERETPLRITLDTPDGTVVVEMVGQHVDTAEISRVLAGKAPDYSVGAPELDLAWLE
jgi:hypothetical protein